MILSRISKALREQNWLAVAIEFVIVILGVVIGFQVTAWNGERIMQERETAILTRLRDELVADQRSRQASMNNENRLTALREAVAVVFGEEGDVLDWAQCNAVQTSSYYSDVSASSALPALEELLNDARGLNLISDEALRNAVAEYVHFREGVPRLVDWYVRGSTSLPTAFPDLIPQIALINSETGAIWTRATCDLDGMRANRAFLNAFSENAWRYEYYFRSLVAGHVAQADALIEELSRVIGEGREQEATP
ncbi:hypothetical protein [uncultured Maricaulis sp.]|uniref:hypothetical protein n=1 Tax=uncultured Maricaulis sp. TaxID=174710 RepID=UPI00261EEBC8|nr:hypothetical protein [uncultured Maricaulis sp.]